MAINTYGAPVTADTQVFEYDKTLSLPVDKTKNVGAAIGSVVSIGARFGILVSEIGMTEAEIAAAAKVAGFDPVSGLNPAGYNAPGYASVRVKGGAFRIKGVAHTAKIEAGDKIYAKQEGNKVVVTTTAAGATELGFAYQPSTKASGPSDVVVVLNG